MKAIELFAGVGGFRLGLERAGHEVVWANEWDKYAAQTYDKNFSDRGMGRDGEQDICLECQRPKEGHGTGTHLFQDNRDLRDTGDSPRTEDNLYGTTDEHIRDQHQTAGTTSLSRGDGSDTNSINAQGATTSHGIDTRDITTIPASQIPAHDLIVGGFPCQAFSVAGKRRGFEETRGTLFFEIMRIADYHKTKYLFLENVKGLLNHDGGRTFEVILETLDEFGYDVQWQVCNSKDFGVPQNRERVIIIANLRTEPRPQVFPLGSSEPETIEFGEDASGRTQSIATRHLDRNGKLVSDIAPTVQATETPHVITGSPVYGEDGKRSVNYTISDTVPTIRATQHKSGDNQPKIVQINRPGLSAAERVYSTDGLTPTLSANGGGGGAKTGLYAVEEPFIVAQRGRYNEDGSTEQKLEPRFDGLSNTLTAVEKDNRVYAGRIRRLTPMECERLQSFPDNWTKYGLTKDGETVTISDTQRYKQMGNAVTVNVIEEIAKKLPL